MIIKTISFNDRGLNKSRKINRLHHYFQNFQGGMDVILLQEHKLRGKKATNLGRHLLPNSKSWTLEADPGYNVLGQEGAGKGRISTILHRKLASLVSDQGTILQNRAH